ncbi:hypothetical protein CR513_52030, partial [Mucuna pruriens]
MARFIGGLKKEIIDVVTLYGNKGFVVQNNSSGEKNNKVVTNLKEDVKTKYSNAPPKGVKELDILLLNVQIKKK